MRSSTTVTPEVFEKATNLKVIGRAGIGVDNIDVKAATNAGVIVMNTPFGNSITTAEHAIAMMFALARQIPKPMNRPMPGNGKRKNLWARSFIIRRSALLVAGILVVLLLTRAVGLKMNVIAFDPFLTEERAVELGVEKVELMIYLSG